MKFYILFIFLFCFIITKGNSSISLNLKGRVIDSENSQPIPFCNIIQKGKPTKGCLTNYQGSFSLETNLSDTLIISYVGYQNCEYIIMANKEVIIKLEKKAINLPEFIARSNNKKFNAKKIIEKVREKWTENHYTYNRLTTTKIGISPNFKAYKNDEIIYKYLAEAVNLIGIDNTLFSNSKDTAYRYQKEKIPINVYNFSGGSPYFLINMIFFKPAINKKYHFEFGTIQYYNHQEVYHVQFYKKEGRGICEGGGYYLISKKDFSLIYCEYVTSNCIGFENKREKLTWKHSKYQVFYTKKNSKYSVNEVRSNVEYLYNKDRYHYNNNLVIKQIEENKLLNQKELIPAKDIFYNSK
jgi:hypothetical protein